MEEALLWILAGLALFIGLLGVVGGLMTPVGGRWRDDDRLISLRQMGPFVSGSCPRPGGGELYRGFALFGTLRVTRYAHGRQHLLELGFASNVIPLLERRAFAHLTLELDGNQLHGSFVGRKFSTAEKPPSIRSVSDIEATPRNWTRVD